MGEAILTLLSAMTEVESSVQRHFTRNVVKIIFVLSPGYATLPEPVQFVYTLTPTSIIHFFWNYLLSGLTFECHSGVQGLLQNSGGAGRSPGVGTV